MGRFILGIMIILFNIISKSFVSFELQRDKKVGNGDDDEDNDENNDMACGKEDDDNDGDEDDYIK